MGSPDQSMLHSLRREIAAVDEESFEPLALRVFRYQASENTAFRQWLDLLGIRADSITLTEQIPFFPIQFFKTKKLQTGSWLPEAVFSSSGTTGMEPSQHLLRDMAWYLQNTERGFANAYGRAQDFAWLCLLPSYLERKGSSLVAMADHFIRLSKYPESGFFLDNMDDLEKTLKQCMEKGIPAVLLGVSFALLEMAEKHPLPLHKSIVMETGGMKGRRKEMTREELHRALTNAFDVKTIHSEYGMTELLSQAYSKGNGLFRPAQSMRVLCREITDSMHRPRHGRTGVLDIIDLANVDTLSFIATDDLGTVYDDHSFEVLGRLDNSDIRGCNLLVL